MSKTYPAGRFVIDSDVLRSAAGSVMIGNESWPIIEQAVLAKRDDELGRWRSKDHPEYVVYPATENSIVVFDERTAEATTFVRKVSNGSSAKHQVAREYFDSIEPPKPWLAAKPGEVWELTIYGEKRAHVMQTSGRFLATDNILSTPGNYYGITAGRRIYPEADNV